MQAKCHAEIAKGSGSLMDRLLINQTADETEGETKLSPPGSNWRVPKQEHAVGVPSAKC